MATMRDIKWGTPSSLVCTAIVFVFSILAFISGIVMMNSRNEGRDLCTEKATASVIKYHEYTREPVNRKQSSYKVYSPVYRFEYKGRPYTVIGPSAESKQFDIGEEVELMYDPDDPDNFYVPAETASALGTRVCLIIALISLIIAFGMLWLSLAAKGSFDHGEGGWKEK